MGDTPDKVVAMCSVQGCDQQPEVPLKVAPIHPAYPMTDMAVCAAHNGSMLEGEPWFAIDGDHGRPVVLMGEDLREYGLFKAAGIGHRATAYLGGAVEQPKLLYLTGKFVGDDEESEIKILLSSELRDMLRNFLPR
jgi:hypothetical protein